jgi:hypothetical protein
MGSHVRSSVERLTMAAAVAISLDGACGLERGRSSAFHYLRTLCTFVTDQLEETNAACRLKHATTAAHIKLRYCGFCTSDGMSDGNMQ